MYKIMEFEDLIGTKKNANKSFWGGEFFHLLNGEIFKIFINEKTAQLFS
jgi:hypothetical protein